MPRCPPRAAGATSGGPTPNPAINRAGFVQLELAGRIGLTEGRYLIREDDRQRVLIVQELGTARPARRGRRRQKRVEPGTPEQVPVTIVTVTGESLPDSARAAEWLKSTMADGDRARGEVRAATRIVNRALAALRAGAADPLVQEIGASRALAVRIGHGTGEELADGRWTEATELAKPRRHRLDDVEPQSRVAAVLAGRDEVHPAETLTLRARLDAEQGRHAEARYGVRAALAALEERPSEREKEIRRQLDAIREKIET